MIDFVYAWLAALTLACTALVTFGLHLLLQRLNVGAKRTQRIIIAVPVLLLGWLLLTGVLAGSGVLAVWDARPARLPFIPLTALIVVVALNFSTLLAQLRSATPRHWPVALQSFRIAVELSFWGLFAAGRAPVQVTFEGRNFDVLVGVTAPFIALAIARLNLHPRWVILWNMLGLGILFNTIVTTFTSTPGPLYNSHWAAPFTGFATWPVVWIPAFLAPLAIFLHIYSIRQNVAALKLAGKSLA